MSIYRLDRLFRPRSLSLVGASIREGSLGRAVLRNIVEGGFLGSVHVVNPKYKRIEGLDTVPGLSALGEASDLVVITAPPSTVPAIVAEAASMGSAVAIIITAGLGRGPGSLAQQCLQAARPHGLRIVGPNVLGVLVPPAGLNASFAAGRAKPGELALVSQSGAIAAGLIKWSAKRSVGFSGIVSIGDAIDVDFGDLLDHFAIDSQTRAILLYIEAVTGPAKFLSAARAAARIKPVIVIKAGRQAQAAKAAATHTGALAGSDAVYDAVFRRAGLLRVSDLDEMFVAAEALSHVRGFPGKELAILTNGGGVGVLAVDRLIALGGRLSEFSSATLSRLDAVLPAGWSKANPVDIIGDADAERYVKSLEILLSDANSDAIVVLNVPTALASANTAACALAETVRSRDAGSEARKPVFAGWIAESAEAGEAFEAATVAHYSSEAGAIQGFMHLAGYAELRETLMEMPEAANEDATPDTGAAQHIITQALADGRQWLTVVEAGTLLEAYRIPSADVSLAANAEEALAIAEKLLRRFPSLAVKILSPDIVHKSDVGGVRLNLSSPEAVCDAAEQILASVRRVKPEARIAGVTVHPMIVRPHARELIAGIADDSTFGPVIVFGCGGTAVEVINDKALALPPLDLRSADELIGRTRISRLLAGYRDVKPADRRGISLTLVKLSQLAADLPEIRALDLNPLLADDSGVIVLDTRVAIAPFSREEERARGSRLSIRPYPNRWQRAGAMKDGTIVRMRPIRPEDEGLLRVFFSKVAAHDLRLRFFSPVRDLNHPFVARLTQLDYGRAIAFIVFREDYHEVLGMVHLHADANYETGEFAILVRSDLKGQGLGWMLMQLMLDYARAERLKRITGHVLRENKTMLKMCEELGFASATIHGVPEVLAVTFVLDSPHIDVTT
jgi:acetyltransferase